MMHQSHAAAKRSKTHHAAATHAHAYTHAQAQMPQTNFLEQFSVLSCVHCWLYSLP